MARSGRYLPVLSMITILALVCHSIAQTKLVGSATSLVGSATVVNPGNTYTKVYVVFPPQAGDNNTNFKASVMTQAAIDGVTIQVPWNAVETATPSTTPCAKVLLGSQLRALAPRM